MKLEDTSLLYSAMKGAMQGATSTVATKVTNIVDTSIKMMVLGMMVTRNSRIFTIPRTYREGVAGKFVVML